MKKKKTTKKTQSGKKKIRGIILAELVLLGVFLIGAIILLIWNRYPDKISMIPDITAGGEPEAEGGWVLDENPVKIEPENMPQPEYDFTIEEVEVQIPGLDREYTLAWVSDLHLISDHEAGEVQKVYLYDLEERYETLPVTEDGLHAEELWPEIIKYLNAGSFDAIIFGGDMMDYCSTSNVSIIQSGLEQLYAPYLYIRADHDYGTWYGGNSFTDADAQRLHAGIDGDTLEGKYLDFGEFIVAGVNNSTKDMPNDQLYMLEDLYNLGKPVIAVTHVPYASEVDGSLKTLSMQVRNEPYYWGDGRYMPNDNTQEYLHMIYRENTKVRQVLAGHLHASWDGMLTEQVPEHIFGPAFNGHIGVIHIRAAVEDS